MTLLLTACFAFCLFFIAIWQIEHIRKSVKFLQFVNKFRILPIYTFFSPNPGMVDTHVLYRDSTQDGDLSGWEQTPTVIKRSFYHFIWNPEKRLNKLTVDAISEIKLLNAYCEKKKLSEEDTFICIRVSKGYLILVNLVAGFKRISERSSSRQFLIINVLHDKDGRRVLPLFCSAFHNL
jgi:hypothetical protein